MQLDLKDGSFYKFVSGIEEDRRLFYRVEGERLSLTVLIRFDAVLIRFDDYSRSLLEDDTRDGKYIYCPYSVDYVPSLAYLLWVPACYWVQVFD